jgi:catechol 2,3-dioxygenase-like lactoylglutathione lyase family enzyme
MAIVSNIGAVRYNVAKWNEANKFWRETIGLPVVWASDEAGWAEFGPADGCHIAIQRATPEHPVAAGDRGVVGIFYVKDAFQTVTELRSRGVQCDDVEVIPGVVATSRFYDPEGNVIGIAGEAPK